MSWQPPCATRLQQREGYVLRCVQHCSIRLLLGLEDAEEQEMDTNAGRDGGLKPGQASGGIKLYRNVPLIAEVG